VSNPPNNRQANRNQKHPGRVKPQATNKSSNKRAQVSGANNNQTLASGANNKQTLASGAGNNSRISSQQNLSSSQATHLFLLLPRNPHRRRHSVWASKSLHRRRHSVWV